MAHRSGRGVGPEILAQPADEFDAALGEALEPCNDACDDAAGGGRTDLVLQDVWRGV